MMDKWMEKILAFIRELFEEDFDEDGKEVATERMDRETNDRPVADRSSRPINPMLILDLVLSALITMPLFSALPMAGTKLFHTGNTLYFEHLFVLAVIALCLLFLFQVFRKYMYAAVLVLLMAYTIHQKEIPSSGSFLAGIVRDYKTASRKVIGSDISFLSLERVKRQNSQHKYLKQILQSDITPKSRNFAVNASIQFFSNKDLYEQFGDIIRYLSLFKYINENFNYVNDPASTEYYSTAEETIDNGLAGDCDDRAALIYASIKAVGGQARLVLVRGHVYPEIYVGSASAFEARVVPLLDSLFEQAYTPDYFHHVDKYQNVWLSFDFGEYPGDTRNYADIEEILY
jgi:hypothetical protein